jgi:hypothetical protein
MAAVRFWGRHLLLLNVVLLVLVCLLYGDLRLHGHGRVYAEYARDFSLEDLKVSDSEPHVENFLLPAMAAMFKTAWRAIGFEYTDTTFLLLAALPYALFIYGVTRAVSRGGRVLAVAAAIALYTSGMIPYMVSWGGYVDGLAYLWLLPVFVRPASLPVYAIAFVLASATHYLGAVALLMFAFVWHCYTALEQEDRAAALRAWLIAMVPRVVLSAACLVLFMSFWQANYPEVAGIRQQIVAQKWQNPEAAAREVLGRFPWTIISTLKLVIVPVAALALAARPRRGLRVVLFAIPFAAGTALTLLFFDVTRIATMVVMPALLMTLLAARRDSTLPPGPRRQVRRLLIATVLLNLVIPNYYVNDGDLRLPASPAIEFVISTVMDLLT